MTDDYDLVTNMTCIDLSIREVLRVFQISRQAAFREYSTTTHICGRLIEKGLNLPNKAQWKIQVRSYRQVVLYKSIYRRFISTRVSVAQKIRMSFFLNGT